MVNTPVWKLVTTLAIPTVISMLITSIYNMADTFFVSQISTQASAAVGIVFPIMSIIQACGFTLGMGSGSLVSIKLGQKHNDEATRNKSFICFSISLSLSLCLCIKISATNPENQKQPISQISLLSKTQISKLRDR